MYNMEVKDMAMATNKELSEERKRLEDEYTALRDELTSRMAEMDTYVKSTLDRINELSEMNRAVLAEQARREGRNT